MGLWARMKGAFSSTRTKTPGPRGRVIKDQPLWDQFERVGGSITPAQVSEIIRLADTGDMSRIVDLANEMRQKDGHLQAVLQTRESALCGLDWELVYPGQDPKSNRGGRQRRFVDRTLRSHAGLRGLIAHLTGAAYYGFAVAETQWAVDGDRLVPERFVHHNPRRFGFRQADGRFVWRDPGSAFEGIDFLAKWPDQFVVSQPRINGDVPCREGLVRVLMWLALFRNWALSDWLKLAEIAWKPLRIGKYDKSASQEDIDDLETMLSELVSSGAITHPSTTEIDIRWPDGAQSKGQGGTHDALFEMAGREMSKATLGQTLTTEQGNVGSRALGTVHNQVRMDILAADAAHVADVITRSLIEPLVRLNFGPAAPVPRFQFITEDATDMLAFASALEKLSPILPMPADWARDKLGIPHPTGAEGEQLVGGSVDVDLEEVEIEAENDDDDADAA